MLFGRDFQMRGPTDRKPREPSVVLRRGSIRRSVEEDQSGRVGCTLEGEMIGRWDRGRGSV